MGWTSYIYRAGKPWYGESIHIISSNVVMADTTINLIEHWKRTAPRPKEQIPFASIMDGLSSPYSAVEFKEETIGRWSVS